MAGQVDPRATARQALSYGVPIWDVVLRAHVGATTAEEAAVIADQMAAELEEFDELIIREWPHSVKTMVVALDEDWT